MDQVSKTKLEFSILTSGDDDDEQLDITHFDYDDENGVGETWVETAR